MCQGKTLETCMNNNRGLTKPYTQSADRNLLRDLIVDYLESIKSTVQAPTLSSYQQKLRHFEAFMNCNYTPVESVNLNLVSAYLSTLFKVGMATTNINGYLYTLRAFFRFLLEKKCISDDTLKDIPSLKNANHEFVAWQTISRQQSKKILQEIGMKHGAYTRKEASIIYLMRCAGLRVSELCDILTSDFNKNSNFLPVRKGEMVLRYVGIDEKVKRVLKSYIESLPTKSEFLFSNRSGGKCRRSAMYKFIRPILDHFLGGIQHRSLRNTYAVELIESGIQHNRAREILGFGSRSKFCDLVLMDACNLTEIHTRCHPREISNNHKAYIKHTRVD